MWADCSWQITHHRWHIFPHFPHIGSICFIIGLCVAYNCVTSFYARPNHVGSLYMNACVLVVRRRTLSSSKCIQCRNPDTTSALIIHSPLVSQSFDSSLLGPLLTADQLNENPPCETLASVVNETTAQWPLVVTTSGSWCPHRRSTTVDLVSSGPSKTLTLSAVQLTESSSENWRNWSLILCVCNYDISGVRATTSHYTAISFHNRQSVFCSAMLTPQH